jgi:hypothetical protein
MQPFGEPHERKRETEGRGWRMREEDRRALPRRSLNPLVSNSPLKGGLYIDGWGVGLPLHEGKGGGGQRGARASG